MSHSGMDNGSGKSAVPLSVVGAAGWFLALWLLDFPKPMMDDLAYIGAGLHMAAGGDYSNPLLAGQGFPSHYFFVHTPLLSYALAGWLKVFGVSSASMTGFQMAMFFVIAVSTLTILRRNDAPTWLEWLVPLGVGAAFLRGGLRVEPLATALTMAGFAWIECGGKGRVAVFGSFLLMFLGASASPRFGAVSIVLAGSAGWRLWHAHKSGKERRWILCLTLFAALLTGLTFLIMIHFRLREFLATFHFHASGALARAGNGLASRFLFLLTALGVTNWPLLLLVPVFVGLRLRRPGDELAPATVALCAILPVTFMLGLLGFGAGWYLFLILLFVVPAIVRETSHVTSASLALALALSAIVANGKPLIEIFGIVTGQINEKESGERAAALALKPDSAYPVLVDVFAARYAFNYRIPPGLLNFEFAAPFPHYLILDVDFPREDIFVLGPEGVHALHKRGLCKEDPVTWSPFGSERWAFCRYPRQVSVIPASTCFRP